MKNFFSMFPESAKNLKDVKALTTMSMLMALQIILGIFTIPIGPTIKITFGYLAISCLGMLFGPVPAFLAGGIVDIISYFLTDRRTIPSGIYTCADDRRIDLRNMSLQGSDRQITCSENRYLQGSDCDYLQSSDEHILYKRALRKRFFGFVQYKSCKKSYSVSG